MAKRKTYALGKRLVNSYHSYINQRNELKRKMGYGLSRQLTFPEFKNVYYNLREMQIPNKIYHIIQQEKNYTFTEARQLIKRVKASGNEDLLEILGNARALTKLKGKKARQEVFEQILDATDGDYDQARIIY